MKKILVVGDFHGKFPRNLEKEANKADIVLCTGDFGGSDKLLKIIFNHLGGKWWKAVGPKKAKEYVLEDYVSGKNIIKKLSKIKTPVYIIPGNWDFTTKTEAERNAGIKLRKYQDLVKDFKNLKWWNRGIKKVGKLRILAFGGMVTAAAYLEKQDIFDEKRRKKEIRRNKKEIKQILRHGDKKIDILLIHYPPFNYFDKVDYPGENPMNGKHVGFKGYTEYIKRYHPKLVVCGHMHEYQGIKTVGKTKIVATGAAKEGKAVKIDYDEDKKKISKIEFIK
jgi:Icc-related predicted phosphoesterase